MDIGFIVASCSRLGRAGSLSYAGGGHRRSRCWPEKLSQSSRGAHTYGRGLVGSAGQGRRGDGERWIMAEGKEGESGYGEGIFAGRFPVSLAPPGRAFLGTSGVLGRAARTRPCPGRGKRPGVPGSPRRSRGLLPPSCPLPAGLRGNKNPRHYQDTEAHCCYHGMLFCHRTKGFKITLCRRTMSTGNYYYLLKNKPKPKTLQPTNK